MEGRVYTMKLNISDPTDIEMGFNIYPHTLLLFNIAMENGSFIDDFPIKTSIYKGCSMAMLNSQMVDI